MHDNKTQAQWPRFWTVIEYIFKYYIGKQYVGQQKLGSVAKIMDCWRVHYEIQYANRMKGNMY